MQTVDAPDVDPGGGPARNEISDPFDRLIGDADRFCEVVTGARRDGGEAAGALEADYGVGDSATGAVASDRNDGCETFSYRSLGKSLLFAGRRGVENVADTGAVSECGLDGGEPRSVAPAAGGRVDDEADAG